MRLTNGATGNAGNARRSRMQTKIKVEGIKDSQILFYLMLTSEMILEATTLRPVTEMQRTAAE